MKLGQFIIDSQFFSNFLGCEEMIRKVLITKTYQCPLKKIWRKLFSRKRTVTQEKEYVDENSMYIPTLHIFWTGTGTSDADLLTVTTLVPVMINIFYFTFNAFVIEEIFV